MSLCQDTGHARVTTSSFYTKKTTVVTHTRALYVHYSVWLNIGRYCSGGILNVKTLHPLLKYTSVHPSITPTQVLRTGQSIFYVRLALLLHRRSGSDVIVVKSLGVFMRRGDVNVRSCFCLRWAQRSPRPYLKWSSLNVKWVSTMPVVFTRVRSTSCWVGM